MTIPSIIPVGIPAEIFAISGIGFAISGPRSLTDLISVHRGCPIPLEVPWPKWIALSASREIADSPLVMIRPLPTTQAAQDESPSLHSLLKALLLLGVPSEMKIHMVRVVWKNDQPDVVEHGRVHGGGAVSEEHPFWFIDADLDAALGLARTLEGFQKSPKSRLRLWRSCSVYWKTLLETDPYLRIRGMIQALDGLFPTNDVASSRDRFKTAIGRILPHAAARSVFGQAYLARNRVEHLRDSLECTLSKTGLDNAFQKDDLLLNRLRQVEWVLRDSLRRILSSSELLAYYESEISINAYWQADDDIFRRLWGDPFLLENVPFLEKQSFDRISQEHWTAK